MRAKDLMQNLGIMGLMAATIMPPEITEGRRVRPAHVSKATTKYRKRRNHLNAIAKASRRRNRQ